MVLRSQVLGTVDLNKGGKGKARVPIINIPKFVAFGKGSCIIEVDVLFRRKQAAKGKK